MALPGLLLNFGLKQLFDAGSKEAADWLDSRFHDSSRDVLRAVFDANGRAWKVVGAALTERTFLERVSDPSRDSGFKAARKGVRQLLELMPADQRARAAAELLTLHEQMGDLNPETMEGADALRRFSDPAGVADDADRAAATVADTLTDAPNLVVVLSFRPDGRVPLFQTFYRYYFWKSVRQNTELERLLTLDQLRALRGAVETSTAGILDQFDALFDHLDTKFAEVNAKLDAGFAAASAKLDDIHRIVARVAARKKSTGLTECTEDELKELHAKLLELRARSVLVSARQLERIGDDLAEIELFDEARQVHTQAANATTDAATEAANHYKAYLSACSVANWAPALESLNQAVEIDAPKYQPFPCDRYELVRVLGGGAFGTVFLCRDLSIDELVAIKSLRLESLSRKPEELFKEARTLHALKNANIIGIKNQWFADSAKTRPYFVLEYFDGETLDKLGVLPVADALAVALQAARALHAAHAAGVLHRDFKLANVMAKKEGHVWLVKVIDFGLALPAGARARSHKNTKDKSVTGTLDFAPPEQTGDLKAVVGPYSDVFAFGKTFIRVLFGVPTANERLWRTLPADVRGPFRELLESCVEYYPQDRPPTFEPVLRVLAQLAAANAAPVAPQPTVAPKPPEAEEDIPFADLLEEPVVRAQSLELNPLNAKWQELADVLPKPEQPPANPTEGQVYTPRTWIPEPEHAPGELLSLKATIPAPKHSLGALVTLRWKAVPKRPNPNT